MQELYLSNLKHNTSIKGVCISSQQKIKGGGYKSIRRNTISGNQATSFVLEEDSNGVVRSKKVSKNISKEQIGDASVLLSASGFGPLISILKNGFVIET